MKALLALTLLLQALLAAGGGAIKLRRTDAYLERLRRLVHRRGLMRCLFFRDTHHLPDSRCFVKYHVSHRMEYFLSIMSSIVVDVVYQKHTCKSFNELTETQSCIKIVSLDFSKQFKLHIRTEEEKKVLVEVVTEFVKFFAYMHIRKVNDLQVNQEQNVKYRAPEELQPLAVNRIPFKFVRRFKPDEDEQQPLIDTENQFPEEQENQPDEDQIERQEPFAEQDQYEKQTPDQELEPELLAQQNLEPELESQQGQELEPEEDQDVPSKTIKTQQISPDIETNEPIKQQNPELQKAFLQALTQHLNKLANKDDDKEATDQDGDDQPQSKQPSTRIPLIFSGNKPNDDLPARIRAQLERKPNQIRISPVNGKKPQTDNVYQMPIGVKNLSGGNLPFTVNFREAQPGEYRADRMMKQIVKVETQPEQASKLSLM